MTCNIDRTGRQVRALLGAFAIALALVWFALAPGASWLVHGLQALLALGGAFSVLEGLIGWCAIRAMGVRTPF